MGHDREYSSPVYRCEECGEPMEAILGGPISMLGFYREVRGYRCPNEAGHKRERADTE